jgi:hypothetical protein
MSGQVPDRVLQAPSPRFTHDVFVVHTDASRDVAFVEGYLLPSLGVPHERVFRLQSMALGRPILDEIERLLSDNYISPTTTTRSPQISAA